MRLFYLIIGFLFLSQSTLSAQEDIDLSYYLPSGIAYDPAIPKPSEVIGHEVGTWHVTHDKLLINAAFFGHIM